MAFYAGNLILPNSPTKKKNIRLFVPNGFAQNFAYENAPGIVYMGDTPIGAQWGGDWTFGTNLETADIVVTEGKAYTWSLSEDKKSTITISFAFSQVGTVPEGTPYPEGDPIYSFSVIVELRYNGQSFSTAQFSGGDLAVSIKPTLHIGLAAELEEKPYIRTKTDGYICGYVALQYKGYSATENVGFHYVLYPLLAHTDGAKQLAKNFIDGADTEETYDPYNPDGDGQSGTGGGEGDFDGTSDSIDVPNLPEISATDTGFVGLFTPSLSQLKALSDYMWSDLFSVETFKKIFADPMDCILGLSIVPVKVPTGDTAEVKVGNISTGVSMTKAASEFVSVDCGTLNINEFWGSFLDYSPHTKISIYLPYIGFRPLNTDEIMGKALRIVYHVDILTGALIAYIKAGNSVISTFEGACASNIPLSATDWTSTINGILSIAESAVSAAATGGIAGISKAAGQMALSGAQNISALKPTIEHSGSVSGAGAIMAIQKPYILASRPNQCLPKGQSQFSGYPSFITAQIGDQSGFTVISEVNPTGISATEEEEEEIISLLKSGVFV